MISQICCRSGTIHITGLNRALTLSGSSVRPAQPGFMVMKIPMRPSSAISVPSNCSRRRNQFTIWLTSAPYRDFCGPVGRITRRNSYSLNPHGDLGFPFVSHSRQSLTSFFSTVFDYYEKPQPKIIKATNQINSPTRLKAKTSKSHKARENAND